MKCFCTFENRPDSWIGLKLLALSLERHCRDFTLCVGMVEGQEELAKWLRRRAPHVVQVPMPAFRDAWSVWSVKPRLMLQPRLATHHPPPGSHRPRPRTSTLLMTGSLLLRDLLTCLRQPT